jgi:hypothetical protein
MPSREHGPRSASASPRERPVGQTERDQIAASGWRAFPPRLAGQPIFYPVLNEEYATRIARDWNTKDPASGFIGYVLRFEVERPYVDRFETHRVGGKGHRRAVGPC